jgi:hypothetical protein
LQRLLFHWRVDFYFLNLNLAPAAALELRKYFSRSTEGECQQIVGLCDARPIRKNKKVKTEFGGCLRVGQGNSDIPTTICDVRYPSHRFCEPVIVSPVISYHWISRKLEAVSSLL